MATATLDNPLGTNQPLARRFGDFPETEYITVRDVPVFAEHEGKVPDADGNLQSATYDRARLEAIVEASNHRIQDTGDYAAIIARHTPEKSGEDRDPPLVGFAGPFRLGMIGAKNPRYAILADFHVLRDQQETFRRYPRRSVELWTTDDGQQFIDPIALLGAETPRLDLGLLYSRRAALGSAARVQRYAAVAPSATSVFVPSEHFQAQSQENGSMALSPEDIQQIVQAIESLDWVQYVKAQMEAGQGADAGADADPDQMAALQGYQDRDDATGAGEFLGALPDQDRDKLKRCMSRSAAGKAFYDRASADGADDKEKDEDMADDKKKPADEPEKFARGSSDQVLRFARLQRELDEANADRKALGQRVAQLESANRAAQRYQRLQELNRDFVFDLDEEAKDVAHLDDKAWERHQKLIVSRYMRSPVGQRQLYSMPADQLGDGNNKERAAAARDLALSKGISYEAAKAELAAANGRR